VTQTTNAPLRPATDVDAVADRFLAELVALSPITATYLGIPGHEEDLDDFSPAGLAAHSELRRRTLAELDRATPADDIDRVTVAAMRERLTVAEETHAAGIDEMALNVIASPMQEIRGAFDLMATATEEDWGLLSRRMSKVPQALEGWQESLLAAAAKGNIAPRRQVEACIKQCQDLTADDGYFASLVDGARLSDGDGDGSLGAQTRDQLAAAVEHGAKLGG